MGTAASHRGEGVETSKRIDKELEKERIRLTRNVKLLLLGGSESGKSTLVKQMKILHKDGFSKKEREEFKDVITTNIIEMVRITAEAMNDFSIDFDSSISERYAATLSNNNIVEKEDYYLSIIAEQLRHICKDTGFTSCIDRGSEYGLGDAAKYFCENIERITSENYVPSDRDILSARMPTTGIIETNFQYHGFMLQLIDVGGQKSERRKWIHCFENVTAVMFTVAMSFYDQMMPDNSELNRLHESVELFDSITKYVCFKSSSFLLFLNKKDIFEEKLRKVPLNYCYPDYEGSNTYEECSSYIQDMFQRTLDKKRDIYCHFTNATDTKNIDFVFQSSMSAILHKNLQETGFC